MKKISIIIPTYNVEKYLKNCLESILAQNLETREYEVIIVDDGSTDSTIEIAKSFDFKSINFSLFHQEHIGVGAARNIGINEAKGKYLFFMDADDTIHPNRIRNLLKILDSNDLDILRFNYELADELGNIIPRTKNSMYRTKYSEKIVNGEIFLTDYLGWACYTWSFIFKASLIKNNRILFNNKIYFEDIEWLLRVLPIAQRVKSVDIKFYVYLQRSGSITQARKFIEINKTINDKLFILNFLKRYSKTANNPKIVNWCNGMISLTYISILAYTKKELPERKKEIINLLKHQNYWPLKSYHFTFKQWVKMFLININPKLFNYLVY